MDHSDVVGARLSALLQLHLHSPFNTWVQYIAQTQLQAETRNIKILEFGVAYIRDLTVLFAQAWVHCDNKPWQTGPYHDYSMTFFISTHWMLVSCT